MASHSHARGAGTGAGIATTAARDEAAVLSASAHLTDRDRDLVRLIGRRRVLTTGQVAALAFGSPITAMDQAKQWRAAYPPAVEASN